MIIDTNENITIFTQETGDITTFVSKIKVQYERYRQHNLIICLTTAETISLQDLLAFLQISNTHRKYKHSFVLVSNTINLDIVPDEIIVVPTIQEAYDIIEMEEIERNLGI